MAEAYDPDTPAEVGKVLFSDDAGNVHTGMISISADEDAVPINIVTIPEAIQDEFEFVFVVSKQVAFYFNAIQAQEQDIHVDEAIKVAANVIWWLTIRVGTYQWKEIYDQTDH